MKRHLFSLLALSSVLGIAACERRVVVIETPPATPVTEPVAKTKTLETERLGAAVDTYEREPTTANAAAVRKTMAQLDSEIAELQEYIAKHDGEARAKAEAKLTNMQSYRAAEATRFATAQTKSAIGLSEPADARTGADKVEDTAKKVGRDIEGAAKKTGDAIKDALPK